MNKIELQKTYWASVSGGKDSLYMLAHILHNLDKYPLNGVVHFELEIDYPFIKNVIDYMERECKKFSIPFLRIKPRRTWNDLYNEQGFPSRWRRWCNGAYKLDCKKQLDEFMKAQNKQVIYYIGYCYNELNRANKHKTDTEVYPLVDMGVYESTIWEWARNQSIFSDYYKYNKRCGCMYCPMATMQEHRYLLEYYPEHFYTLMNYARDTELKQNKPFSVWCGNSKYDTNYRINRVKNMELKEVTTWVDVVHK